MILRSKLEENFSCKKMRGLLILVETRILFIFFPRMQLNCPNSDWKITTLVKHSRKLFWINQSTILLVWIILGSSSFCRIKVLPSVSAVLNSTAAVYLLWDSKYKPSKHTILKRFIFLPKRKSVRMRLMKIMRNLLTTCLFFRKCFTFPWEMATTIPSKISSSTWASIGS